MKSGNWKNIVIVILSIIVIALSVALILVSVNKINDNDIIDVKENEAISYKAEDYVTIEKVDLGSDRVNLEKISFKNLDSSLVEDFMEEQSNMLNEAKQSFYYHNGNNFLGVTSKYVAYSEVWYQVHGEILTIYYKVFADTEAWPCEWSSVINIDLKNKKVVTNEELLTLGGTSFHEIALEHYNDTLETVKECSNPAKNCGVSGKDYKLLEYDEYFNNKDKYVNMIESGLDDVISAYIQNGVVKYQYYGYSIDFLYLEVGKGGCFSYHVVELGEYK